MRFYKNLSILIIVLGLCMQVLVFLHINKEKEITLLFKEEHSCVNPAFPANHTGTEDHLLPAGDKVFAFPVNVVEYKNNAENEDLLTKSITGIIL